MAPAKGAKRSSQAEAAAPQKRAKVDSLRIGIIDAIEKARGLSKDCRAMLVASVPYCFTKPEGSQHEAQSATEAWIADVLQDVQKQLQEAIAGVDEDMARAEGAKAELDGKVVAAQGTVAARTEAVTAKEAKLAEASREVASANARLAEAQKVQTRGGASLAQLSKEKQELEEVLRQFAALLKDEGAFQPAKAEKLAVKLMPLAKKLGLDESLMTAVPNACVKPPSARGKFDCTVVEQFEGGIQKRLAEVTGMFEVSSLAARDCLAVIAEAKKKVATAEEGRQGAQDELAGAQAELREASGVQSEAEAAVSAFASEQETVAASRADKVAALENFKGYNMNCLSALRDQVAQAAQAGA